MSNAEKPSVGTGIDVLWPVDKKRYSGEIVEYTRYGKARVKYDDGDVELLDLDEEDWILCLTGPPDSNTSMTTMIPRVIECPRSQNTEYEPVFDFTGEDRRKAKFRVPRGLPNTVETFVQLFFTDEFLGKIADESNDYAKRTLSENTSKLEKDITSSEISLFFSLIYYMGVVQLPCKDDYWRDDAPLPKHRLTTQITRERFRYIWRYIHLPSIQQEEQIGADNESDSNNHAQSAVWFEKVQYFVNHIRKFSDSLVVRPGSAVCIDEMMVKFKGRSKETHRMKNKPVSQGYKLFAIADSQTGYILSFTPDGRLAREEGLNEFSPANLDGGKLHHMMNLLYENTLKEHVEAGFKFVLFVDNYFTYPRTIRFFRDLGVGIVGTARPKRNWPPKELKVGDDSQYNDLYYCIDDYGTLCMRWVDNNVVF